MCFRTGFRPDFCRGGAKIAPPAGRRPARDAMFALPRQKSVRKPVRKHKKTGPRSLKISSGGPLGLRKPVKGQIGGSGGRLRPAKLVVDQGGWHFFFADHGHSPKNPNWPNKHARRVGQLTLRFKEISFLDRSPVLWARSQRHRSQNGFQKRPGLRRCGFGAHIEAGSPGCRPQERLKKNGPGTASIGHESVFHYPGDCNSGFARVLSTDATEQLRFP